MKRDKRCAALFLRVFGTISAGLFLILLALTGCATLETASPGPKGTEAVSAVARQNAGIRVESLRLAASGLMLDLRYRLVDPEEARKHFSRKAAVTLVDQATGTVLTVPNMPKVGKLRQVPSEGGSDRVFWMFFNNPGGLVKTGGKVTLKIGDVTISDIMVE